MTFVLHSAWRATAPYRVRIGLALKGVAYDYAAIDLVAGQQREPAYRAVNPQGLTPALDIGDRVLTQSLAILEWLEETYPEPAMLPKTPLDRQVVRAMATLIACDVHPLNNTRVARKLSEMGIDQAGFVTWLRGWIIDGFDALDPMIARHGGGFSFGDTPTIADCCLIPQIYSAKRYDMDIGRWPSIDAVSVRAAAHPAFQAAHPSLQPDAVAA